jgi:hypothetical protein
MVSCRQREKESAQPHAFAHSSGWTGGVLADLLFGLGGGTAAGAAYACLRCAGELSLTFGSATGLRGELDRLKPQAFAIEGPAV